MATFWSSPAPPVPGVPLPLACKVLLVPAAVLFVFGMVRLHYNLPVFRVWIREDGLVEWLTVAVLAAMAALAVAQAARLVQRPGRAWWIALAAACAFGALEEISWGQRVFGWHTPAWLAQYNAQDETNIHNLVVGGVKVNRLVFGKMLGIALGLYLLALPFVYERSARVRAFMDERALPIARAHQVVLALMVLLTTETARSIIGKSGEMQEFGLAVIMATVLLHPSNAAARPPLTASFDEWLGRWLEAARSFGRAWLPQRVRFLLLATTLFASLFMALRLVFASAFEPSGLVGPVGERVWDRGVPTLHVTGDGMVPAADVLRAWALGFRFDLRIALLLLLPLALLGGVRALDPWRSSAARRGWLAYLATALAAVLLLHAVDLGHYAYEAERLTLALLDHAHEAGTAGLMVWQTYPVVRGVAALGVLLAVSLYCLSRWLSAPTEALPARLQPRQRRVAAAAVLLYVFGLHGQWSQYPLRWSDAYFSPNGYVSALATNPVQSLFDSLRAPLQRVDADSACAAQALLAPLYGLPACQAPPASFDRAMAPATPGGASPNVVVVFLESFSAFKTGTMGNPLQPTPHFDTLAAESVLFTRFYTASRPTARSIFSSLFGIPDVSPSNSASRNPRTVSQRTLVNAFPGYRKHYFIGGSASWGNIRGMLAHNLPGLQLHEGEYSDLQRSDVWGASDLALFEHAHGVLSAEAGPFIAFIQTAGNHRPYTIPDDNRGFIRTSLPAEVLLAAGFEEPDAYDGMRFMDHALGHFLGLARAAPYYRNTIFVFYGDHGSPARRFPPHEKPLRQQHVPLVLHAPGRLAARRVEDVASSLDVLPTLARLAGVPHVNTTLGRDLLAPRPPAARFAFVTTGRNHGLVTNDWFYGRDALGRETLHRALPDGSLGAEDLAAREPQRLREKAALARAMEVTSAWLLLNNAPRAHESLAGRRTGPAAAAAEGAQASR